MRELIESMVEKSKEEIPQVAGDYIKDGILYCGKCDTPKQGIFHFPWGEMRPRVLCKCESERRRKMDAEKEALAKKLFISEIRQNAFPQREMAGWTFDVDDHGNGRITTIAKRYVEHFDEMRENGKGLLFFGDVGTGKTFYAACIVNALIDSAKPCLMTDFSRLTHTINGMISGKQEYIDSLNEYALLVIDDLSAERDTEYMGEIVYNIINGRYGAGLPIIVTTNLTAEEIKSPKDMRKKRIYSRLLEMCIPVEVKGNDRRREKLKSDFSEYKDILGI